VDSVWLLIYHKKSGVPSLYYDEAVDEALCLGWIDSTPNKRDDHSYYVTFSRRNPKSNWSGVNKEKVQKLIDAGRMEAPGLEMIRIAKESGTWTALDDVTNLVVPPDLEQAFEEHPPSSEFWEEFPPSTKRGILEWIITAKRPETRSKRVKQTAELAAQNIRANQFRK
jgi:uncharacterized protein YdeI (YjbR/CyaY-like superfamily)